MLWLHYVYIMPLNSNEMLCWEIQVLFFSNFLGESREYLWGHVVAGIQPRASICQERAPALRAMSPAQTGSVCLTQPVILSFSHCALPSSLPVTLFSFWLVPFFSCQASFLLHSINSSNIITSKETLVRLFYSRMVGETVHKEL